MMYAEEEYLQLSGLQHFAFCRRQWALIHIEQQWRENLWTAEGDLFHRRAHAEQLREKRGGTLVLRGLSVASSALGLSGKCDVVEFRADPKGISLHGEEGLWVPYPVEYKRGSPKPHQADELQLCAQALCLEEMLCCTIAEGALFYGEIRRRVTVPFLPALRKQVYSMAEEMASAPPPGIYAEGETIERMQRLLPERIVPACADEGKSCGGLFATSH